MTRLPDLRLPRPADLEIKDGRLYDPVRAAWIVATPEEWVRQHVLEFLACRGAPRALMAVEKGHRSGAGPRRADVTVYTRSGAVWMVVECKAPEVNVTQETLAQVSRYADVLLPEYVAVTNGLELFAAARDSGGGYHFVREFPFFPSLSPDSDK